MIEASVKTLQYFDMEQCTCSQPPAFLSQRTCITPSTYIYTLFVSHLVLAKSIVGKTSRQTSLFDRLLATIAQARCHHYETESTISGLWRCNGPRPSAVASRNAKCTCVESLVSFLMWSWCNQNSTRLFRTERQRFARYSTNLAFNTWCVWYSPPSLPDSKLPATPTHS